MVYKLDTRELSALVAISANLNAHKKPTLPVRYWMIAGMLSVFILMISPTAIINPDYFISELISPSVIVTDDLIANTKIRGIFSILILTAWCISHFKIRITFLLLISALFWTTSITFLDLYKLYSLKVFSSTALSTIFLISRPILLISILVMLKDLNAYRKASEIHQQCTSADDQRQKNQRSQYV
jgi:hypothetical protein